MKRSLGLSNAIVKELAIATESMMKKHTVASMQAPYTLRLPGERQVLAVVMMDDKQACWYKTEHSVDVRFKGGRTEVMMKNWINFGWVLHNIILLAYQQPPGKAVLNMDQLTTALGKAYEDQRQRDSIVTQFALSDYLRAMLNTVPFTIKLTEEDPVMRFIKELEK